MENDPPDAAPVITIFAIPAEEEAVSCSFGAEPGSPVATVLVRLGEGRRRKRRAVGSEWSKSHSGGVSEIG